MVRDYVNMIWKYQITPLPPDGRTIAIIARKTNCFCSCISYKVLHVLFESFSETETH